MSGLLFNHRNPTTIKVVAEVLSGVPVIRDIQYYPAQKMKMNQSMFSSPRQFDPKMVRWLLVVGIVLFLFKLWIVGGHDILVKFRPHDDSLFAILATSLLEGNWLGEYNNKTLIKGVGYPLFMAASVWLGTAILTLQHLLYGFVCFLVVVALKPVVRHPVFLLACFSFLVFNPMTYTYPLMSVTLRASLYLSLSLWVLASLLGLWHCRKHRGMATVWWSLSLSMSFVWLWITREETIWIMPGLLAFAFIYLLPFRWNSGNSLMLRLTALIIPLASLGLVNMAVVSKNESHYGVSVVNELKSSEFSRALGGLMRIRHDELEEHVIVSKDAQARAFRASPAFAELEPYLSGESKLPASFYIWRLRSAVRMAGYYDDPGDATRTFDFYRRMGNEINDACENGGLDCHDRSPSIRPVWHAEYNSRIWPTFSKLTWTALSNELFRSDTVGIGSKEDIDTLFYNDLLTGESTLRKSIYFEKKLPNYYRHIVLVKQAFMGVVGTIYQNLVPVLFAVALLVHIFQVGGMIRRRQFKEKPVFGLVILGSIFTILCLLTYVKITIWPVPRPLHTLSPIILLYVVYILLPVEEK